MLSITGLSMYFGQQVLFEEVSLQLNAGSRYGIVGANGSGKSTLLKILAGDVEAPSGAISMPKKVRVGVLRQDHFEYEEVAIVDVVMMGNPELWAAMAEKEQILANAERAFDAERYGELEEIVLRHSGYAMEAKAAAILEGLNIPERLHRDPLSSLSGGYKLRVLLAQTLASDPDLLLLDEPTNHLDIVSIRWLEKFLPDFRGCVVSVSHDQRFLNAVCTHIVDIDYQRALLYTGNYEDFEWQKESDRGRSEAEIQKREKEISDHKRFISRFKAKASKARQAQSRVKRMAKIVIEKLPPSSRRYPNFAFTQARPSGKLVLEVASITKSYADLKVLDHVSLSVNRGDRLAIIGANGIGKSTLLKIIADGLAADQGEYTWGHEARVGYYAQNQKERFENLSQTMKQWLIGRHTDRTIGYVHSMLGRVLFSGDDVDKPLAALSGGEMARVAFTDIAMGEPNVLVLDEPTNHLDIEGIESLAAALDAYEGTIIFVAHDRWFVSQVATRIIEISERGIRDYPGTYDEFLSHFGDEQMVR